MRLTQQFSITLPNELAAVVKANVAAGEYTAKSEMIRDGLKTLVERDQAIESWLRKEVSGTYDALAADPTRVVSAANVRATLAASHSSVKNKKHVFI